MDARVILVASALLFLFYGAFTYPLYCIGRKFGIGTYWAYWVPVYNLTLLFRCAEIPSSNIVWILIPLTGPGFWAYLWGSIARRLGHGFWIYALTSFFCVPILILAFEDSQPSLPSASVWKSSFRDRRWVNSQLPVHAGAQGRQQKLGLYCVSGEFSGHEVDIPAQGIVVGRRPEQANLVLCSHLISAAHAKVWPDASGQGLMVEDLSSTNGTFYLEPGWTSEGEWIEVRSPKLVKPGARIRLGEDAAEFEVVAQTGNAGPVR